jgi:hypothetical protein
MKQCGMIPESRNNGAEEMAVTTQCISKRVLLATNTHSSTEELQEAKLYMCYDTKLWPWVLRDSKPRMIVLAKTSSNLHEIETITLSF